MMRVPLVVTLVLIANAKVSLASPLGIECVPTKCADELPEVRDFPRFPNSGKNCSCEHCTINGFSVCIRGNGEHQCSCAHSVPEQCDLILYTRIEEADENISAICYRSAIRSPPAPFVRHDGKAIRVATEEFWEEEYWRGLTPKNLTLFFDFNVQSPNGCEHEGMALLSTNKDGSYRCRGKLLVGPEEALSGVEIEHTVLSNASEVDIFYEFGVHRERQILVRNLCKGFTKLDGRRVVQVEPELRDASALVSSEIVHFDMSDGGPRVIIRRELKSKSQKNKNKKVLEGSDEDDDEKKKDKKSAKDDDDDDNEDNDDSTKNSKKKNSKEQQKDKSGKKEKSKEEKEDEKEDEEEEDSDEEEKDDDKEEDDDEKDKNNDSGEDDNEEGEEENDNDDESDEEEDDDDEEVGAFRKFLTQRLCVAVWVVLAAAILTFSTFVLLVFLTLRRYYCRSVSTTQRGTRSYVAVSQP